MIPIIISKKKYAIKSISELTTSEFIELTSIKDLDYVSYISWQTGETLENSFFAYHSKVIEDGIGVIQDFTKMHKSSTYDYNKLIDTVGQRHQVERSKKSGLELIVYCLAVSQVRSFDDSKIQQRYDYYMQQNWKKILPSGFFFMRTLRNGQSIGAKLLRMLKFKTAVLSIRKMQDKINLTLIVMNMRLRHFATFLKLTMRKF